MDLSDLIVEVRDENLIRRGQFVEGDLDNFLVVPRANSVGSWSIDLPDSLILPDGSVVPHPLCQMLRTPGWGIIVTDLSNPDPDSNVLLSGPMRDAKHVTATDDPGGTWTLLGNSDTTLIAESECWPEPSNSDGTTQTVANDTRTGAAETLLHQYWDSNVGVDATAERQRPFIAAGTDGGRGATLTKSPRYQNMLELFQEITAGTNLLFDIAQNGESLELRTWLAADLTAAVRMDIANDQLSSETYEYAAPAVTVVNVLGQDVGVDRQFVQRTSADSLAAATLWGVRIEKTIDQRQTDDVTELEQAGDEELANNGSTVTSLQVVPSDDQAQAFSVGDFVTVVVGTEEVAAQVTEKPIQVTGGAGVFIGATVGDPTDFDWESLIDGRTNALESRVSAIERTVEVPASLYTKDEVDALIAGVADVGYRLIEVVKFESSGTFSKADYPDARAFRVRAIDGGAAGGGCAASSSGQNSKGAGGGGGGGAEAFITDIAGLDVEITVTVGAGGVGIQGTGGPGGTSSFGDVVVGGIATGGNYVGSSAAPGFSVYGAPGGKGTVGDILVSGSDGTMGTGSGSISAGGNGGAAAWGMGGGGHGAATGASAGSGAGADGTGYGGGGGGAASNSGGAANRGGNGAAGVVIVEVLA